MQWHDLALPDLLAGATSPIEAPIGFIVNPVLVEGHRCWASWDPFGVRHVHLERFASRNYFEFEAQHRPELVDALYDAYRHRGHVRGTPREYAAPALIEALGHWSKFEPVQRLAWLWWRNEVYAPVRARLAMESFDINRTLAEVLCIELQSTSVPHADWPRALDALFALGERRFVGGA